MRYPQIVLVFILAGCASSAPPTAKTIGPQQDAYRQCVANRSLPLAASPLPADVIAREAAKQCGEQLADVNRAYRKENEQVAKKGTLANRYTDDLQKQVVNEAVVQINQQREITAQAAKADAARLATK